MATPDYSNFSLTVCFTPQGGCVVLERSRNRPFRNGDFQEPVAAFSDYEGACAYIAHRCAAHMKERQDQARAAEPEKPSTHTDRLAT